MNEGITNPKKMKSLKLGIVITWCLMMNGVSGCGFIQKMLKPGLNSKNGSTEASAKLLPVIKTKIERGSRAVATRMGYATLGCSDTDRADSAKIYNFCVSVLGQDGIKISEFGDQPRVALAADGYTVASAIAFYPPNDVIVVGSTTASLGETQGGNGDGFVARYSLNGTRVWIKQFGHNTLQLDSNQRDDFLDVAVDQAGQIYIAGRTRSHFSGPGMNAGNFDALFLKLDSNGKLLFSKQEGTPYDDEFRRVVVDSTGRVILGGQTCGDADGELNAGSNQASDYNAANACPSSKFQDLIFSAYQADGTLIFKRHLGRTTLPSGIGVDSDFLSDLTVSSQGEIFFTGGTASHFSVLSDPAQNADRNGGLMDAFVGMLDSSGRLKWIKMFGMMTPGSNKMDFGRRIVMDEVTGDLLVCAETFGNLAEVQTFGSKSDLVLIRVAKTGLVSSLSHAGALTLGSVRTSGAESCGSLIREDGSITLFGTSDGPILPGVGPAFMARVANPDFMNLLK